MARIGRQRNAGQRLNHDPFDFVEDYNDTPANTELELRDTPKFRLPGKRLRPNVGQDARLPKVDFSHQLRGRQEGI